MAVKSIKRAIKRKESERVEIISIKVRACVHAYRDSWRSAIVAGALWIESRSIKGLQGAFSLVFVMAEVDEGELNSR